MILEGTAPSKCNAQAARCTGERGSVHPVLPTGTVNVTLQNGIPSYEIVQLVAWDEIALPERLHLTPRAFYFGTLSQRGPLSAATLSELLRKFESSIVFFDVNLRQDFWDAEIVGKGLANADILKVNDEEMNRIIRVSP